MIAYLLFAGWMILTAVDVLAPYTSLRYRSDYLFFIRLFRTIHPVVIGLSKECSFEMTSKMLITMFFALFTFSIIFVNLFWHRIRLGQLEKQVEQIKLDEYK
jgi:hypothetical protein